MLASEFWGGREERVAVSAVGEVAVEGERRDEGAETVCMRTPGQIEPVRSRSSPKTTAVARTPAKKRGERAAKAKIEAVGPRILKGGWEPDAPAKYRRQLEMICGLVTPPFALDETPEHTQGRDRDDDFVIETAFQGGALAIVSDDKKHIALAEDETVYHDPRTGNELSAYWPSQFIEHFVNTSGFNINDVDGALLKLAVN